MNRAWLMFQVLKIIGSLGIPYGLRQYEKVTNFESWTLTCLIFLVITGLEALWFLRTLIEIRTVEHRIFSERAGISGFLTSIRADYSNMMNSLPGEDSTFVRSLVSKRVEKLHDDVHVAAEAKEIFVSDNHVIDTSTVTDLFRTGKAKIFREVFRVDGGPIFGDDIHGRAYFKSVVELASSGKISSVKALVVVNPSQTKALEQVSKLLSFYANTPRFEGCAIPEVDFDKLRHNCGLDAFEDFGIYGELLLFRTLGYEPNSHGVYSYGAVKIKKHREFFDSCWELPRVIQLPNVEKPLGIDDVLKL
jgi:hypothetical protein